MAQSAISPTGYCSSTMSSPMAPAAARARASMLAHSRKFPAPKAWAVRPLVPMRTNEQFQ